LEYSAFWQETRQGFCSNLGGAPGIASTEFVYPKPFAYTAVAPEP